MYCLCLLSRYRGRVSARETTFLPCERLNSKDEKISYRLRKMFANHLSDQEHISRDSSLQYINNSKLKSRPQLYSQHFVRLRRDGSKPGAQGCTEPRLHSRLHDRVRARLTKQNLQSKKWEINTSTMFALPVIEKQGSTTHLSSSEFRHGSVSRRDSAA